MKLTKLFKELYKEEKELEIIEKTEKEILKISSSAIKYLHNNEIKKAENLIKKGEKYLKKVDWKNRTIAMQEFTEAYLFLKIKKEKKLEEYPIKNISAKAYLYGVLDLVGELKREFLNELIKGDLKKAYFYLKIMEDIYDTLSSLVIYNKVIPEFRRKLDIARIQLDQALSLFSSNNKFNDNKK